ncbi:MAG: shikimate dehydrogenase [Leptospirillia bacterium]
MRRLYAIIGHPVAHSLSPRFQQAALDKAGIDAAYLPFDIPPEALSRGVEALRTLGASGFNVTIPHKEAILPLLDDLSLTARQIGAVNTVVAKDGRLTGENTDGPGFLGAMERFLSANGLSTPSSVVVFGAGGSARAVLWALPRLGAERVLIVNRTKKRGEDLLGLLPSGKIRTQAAALDDPDWRKELPRASPSLFVNTLSLSAYAGSAHPFPPLAEMPLDGAILYDLSYASHRPGSDLSSGKTPFLGSGDPFRAPCQNGLGMLLLQGALSFELWTGQGAPVEAMESALKEGTRQRELWKTL